MSASTAPAATPDPNSTPANTSGAAPQNTPAQGLLASMLAPVAPARTAAFTLAQDPADGTPATGAALPAEGLSSADFRGEDDDRQDTKTPGNSTGSGKRQGIWRAWMLAGAARWARGGGTQNKRLDMKKARAQAHQVKESRTVNSGPAGGMGAGGGRGSTASGAGGGKSLSSKAPKNSPVSSLKGPKNATGPTNSGGSGAGRGAAGQDTNRLPGRSSAGPKPGPANSGKGGTAPTVKPGAATPSRSPKQSRDTSSSTPKPHKDTKANAGPQPKTGPSGTAGSPGKSGGASGITDRGDKPAKGTGTPKGTKPQTGKDNDASPKTPTSGTDTGAKDATGTEKQPKLSLIKRKKTAPAVPPTATTDKQPAASSDKDEKAKKADTPTADKQPPATPKKTDSPAKPTTPPHGKGKPFTTRPSRETGYRDGTRAAQAAAHVKAYRDGIKDGWADTTDVANREKTRLDQAHTDRKKARKDHMLDLTPTIDEQNTYGPAPIPVKEVTSTHVLLGDGAARDSLTRGEVRNLKAFERRLEAKASFMTKAEDVARLLKVHADQQSAKVTQLAEQARAVEGGDKLLGKLAKMQETAAAQAALADSLYTHAVRSNDNVLTLLLNTRYRYGDMYQAVVDSPETSPAEISFYLEG